MGVLEIVLLVVGGILAALSFLIPAAQEEMPQETRNLAEDEVRSIVDREMEDIRKHVDDVVDEAVEYAVEKTERSLERLTNEKIMAVSEYSDTVLQEIHKNHEETMFLYDMLNQKHANLKDTVSQVNRTVQEVQETKREAEAAVNSLQQIMPEGKPMGSPMGSPAGSLMGSPVGGPMEKSESRPMGKPESRLVGSPMENAAGRSMDKQESKPIGKPEGMSMGRPMEKPEGMSMGGPIDKPEDKPMGGSLDKPIDKAEGMSMGRPIDKAMGSPTDKPMGASMERAADEPGDREKAPAEETVPMSAMNLNFMPEEEDDGAGNKEQILQMYRQGKSTVAIAKELGLGVGEVKLVIDLYKNF